MPFIEIYYMTWSVVLLLATGSYNFLSTFSYHGFYPEIPILRGYLYGTKLIINRRMMKALTLKSHPEDNVPEFLDMMKITMIMRMMIQLRL